MKHTHRANATSNATSLPHDPERELATASYRTKQLIILATDSLLAECGIYDDDPAMQADHLVEQRILPACYRFRYDQRFVTIFAATLQLVRNLLVSDAPFIPNTAGELAALAILTRAREILTTGGAGWEGQASELDPRLPEQLARHATHLGEELEWLAASTLEDTDVLLLFGAPADQDPADELSPRLRSDERALLLFDNWLVPFGNAPRPYVTYDGRAWPVAL